MPLRSVEAATRDDAIAAAREQFGPSARVVGVRRVRSGGVLGFFATERYVAEVAADPFARPDVSTADGSTPSAAETTGGFASSPLSAAAPATAAPSSVGGTGRAGAPARNGAAAYAAAAGQEPSDGSSAGRGSVRSADAFPRSAETAARPLPREDDPVSELAGLFAEAPADSPVPLYGPGSASGGSASRGSVPRAAAPFAPRSSRETAGVRVDAGEPRPPAGRMGLAAALEPAASSSDAPSPFTAALARMVAGDRDVRDAVEEALDQPRVVRGRSDVGSWPSRSASQRPEHTSAPSGSTRQEEEPVGDQVVAPPSTHAPSAQDLPNWAAEPAPVMGSPREEAIAEVLRSALAQGHSDEALAGILRKMLAGASPQTALVDPAAGSLFQDAAVVPVSPAPAAPAAPEAAPMTMSLAMALANAGSAGEAAEVAAPEPVPEVAVPELAVPDVAVPEVAVPDVAADPEPSMFDATNEEAPEVVVDAAPAPVDAPAGDLAAEPDTDGAAADAYEVSGYEVSDDRVPTYEAAGYEPPTYRVPSYRSPAYESPLFDSPLFRRPASDNTSMWGPSVASIWGEPTSSHVPLWGEPVPFGSVSHQADLPIWDDVVSGVRSEQVGAAGPEPLATVTEAEIAPEPIEALLPLQAEAPADEAPADEAPVAEDTAADVTAEEVTADSGQDDVRESPVAELEVAVLAPIFARTASDPAPLSLDATTVMPPLSLLPPLPGSRGGRGRPPVPPASPRSSGRSTGFSAPRTAPPETRPPADDREVPAATESATPAEAAPTAAAAPEDQTLDTAQSAPATTGDAADLPVESTSMQAGDKRTPRSAGSALATVTRLPVTTRADIPEIDLFEELEAPAVPASSASAESVPQPELPAASGTVAALAALGLPGAVLDGDFAGDVATMGTYAALTRALGLRLPAVPELPTGAGEVLFVVGPGVETLRAARTLAAGLRLDPESVQWATRGDLAGLAPRDSRMTTVDAARQRRQSSVDAGTVTIVAVDVPLRTDPYWMQQMLAIWSPVAVWAVVEATRKPEDLEPWLAGLTTVDALILTDTDLSGEPAAALRRAGTPVAVVDGVRATAHRWASLLCERLETGRA